MSRVPAFLTCLDIAGLVSGASTGAGLGNAFLSHVRSVDGIFQVVRAFDDDEVTHVEGDVNPIRDMEIIQTELRLKDIEWVQKQLESTKRTGRSLGNSSLADKARKEEIVCDSYMFALSDIHVYNSIGNDRKGTQSAVRRKQRRPKSRMDEQGGMPYSTALKQT